MKTKPLPFQAKGIRKIRHFGGRALLADEMGLGKSFQSLRYAYEDETWPMVIVCKASLKYNWEVEAKTHLNMRAEVLEGTRPSKVRLHNSPKIVIVNYDILDKWLPYLLSLKPQLIVVDECQAIKNRKTKRSKAVRRLCHRRKHVLMLSGTPLESRPAELFTALNILRPDVFKSWFTYSHRYCAPRRRPWGMEYKGAVRIPELNRILNETCMIRRTKAQVIKDLPTLSRHVVPLPIEKAKEYQEAHDDFIKWLTKNHRGKAKRVAKAKELAKEGYLRRLAAEVKLEAVVEWLDNFLEQSETEKIIVFAIHKKILQALYEKYKKIAVFVDGSVTSKKRHQAVVEFNTNKKKRVFFGQLIAAGAGWSAKACSTIAHVEFSYLPADHMQGDARAHGIGRGQKGRGTSSYYLVARGTVEERLCRILQEKQKIIEGVLDGKGKGESLDVYNQLKQELLRSRRK